MEIQRQVRPQDQRSARNSIAQPQENPLDSGAQFRVVVRLGNVVFGDLVQEPGLAVRRVDRRKDDDRQVYLGLDLAGEGEAVDPRHRQVQQDQVRPPAFESAQRFEPVASRGDLVSIVAQLFREDDQ